MTEYKQLNNRWGLLIYKEVNTGYLLPNDVPQPIKFTYYNDENGLMIALPLDVHIPSNVKTKLRKFLGD